MKQKVQIDVLDVSLYEEGNQGEEYSLIDSALSDSLLRKKNILSGRKSKKILICCLIVIVLTSLVTWFFLNPYPAKLEQVQVKKMTPVQRCSIRSKFLSLNDFIVNFEDGNGKEKIFVCAMALEVSSDNKLLFKEDHLDVRRIIFKKLKQYSLENRSLIYDKNKLRDVLSTEINQQMRENIVSEIYFTKFLIM